MEREEKSLIEKKLEKKGQNNRKSLPSAALVLLGEEHSGRDEMNLAGHPFALLQAPGRQGENELLSESPRTLPDGRIVKARWHVTTPATYGLPGPNEELLYLVLLQLTREAAGNGEWPQKVAFSRYEVLARLDWNRNDLGYKKLEMAFNRLSAVHIAAQHAFWDARHKTPYASVAFGVLSSYGIADEPRGRKGQGHLPLSWFQWDEVLHTSFHAGNVRSLALDFAVSLEHPTSRRLFRLLELLRCADKPPRPGITIGLEKLRDRLGMAPYKFPSKIREKLAPAVEELSQRGYLESLAIERNKNGEWLAQFRFQDPLRPQVVTQPEKGPQIEAQGPLRGDPRQESPQQFALRMHAAFETMPDEQKNRLREEARKNVAPAFWDRLDAPESPMSLGLWQLVAATIAS